MMVSAYATRLRLTLATVAAEMERMGLKWSLDGTCAEIESMSDFCKVLERGEVIYETPRGNVYIAADMVMTEALV